MASSKESTEWTRLRQGKPLKSCFPWLPTFKPPKRGNVQTDLELLGECQAVTPTASTSAAGRSAFAGRRKGGFWAFADPAYSARRLQPVSVVLVGHQDGLHNTVLPWLEADQADLSL